MTNTRAGKRIGRAAVCALALGCVPAAPLAQSLLGQNPSTWQTPPSLTLPVPATTSSPSQLPSPQPAPQSPPKSAPQSALEKISLDADALFDFDARELRPEGRAALDDFVARLEGATLGTIRAVGHADRLGSEAYNQILSEERAEAVKAYLIGKGIAPGRVHAAGRGATQPVTKLGDCPGRKSAQVIACLQPDRRAGIEVAGTRPATHSPAAPAAERH